MFSFFKKETTLIIDRLIEIAYFMKGGITYEQLMLRTPFEIQRMENFLTSQLKSEAKDQVTLAKARR